MDIKVNRRTKRHIKFLVFKDEDGALKEPSETARATDCATGTEQTRKAAVHYKAFTTVLDVIQGWVIGQGGQVEVLQLTSLCRLHIQELETNGFPNFEYRSEKLKARLEQHDMHESIGFVYVNPGDKGFMHL